MKRSATRRCKAPQCSVRFEPNPPWIEHCSTDCGAALGILRIEKAKAAKAKAERKVDKVRKEKLHNHTYYLTLTQAVVNRYVNLRDRGKICISCDKPDKGVRNASHYKSRASNSALRFNLWCINSSCYKCNCELSGNISEYRPRLIERIGIEKVEWLDNHPRSREYSREYLERMRKIFTKKAKRLIKRMEG